VIQRMAMPEGTATDADAGAVGENIPECKCADWGEGWPTSMRIPRKNMEPVSTLTGEAAGDSEPITTQQMSTSHKPRMSVRRAPGGRPNRGWGCLAF